MCTSTCIRDLQLTIYTVYIVKRNFVPRVYAQCCEITQYHATLCGTSALERGGWQGTYQMERSRLSEVDLTVWLSCAAAGLACQPVFKHRIHACLPTWAAGPQGRHKVLVQTNCHLLFCRLFVWATHFAQCRYGGFDAAARAGYSGAPVDLVIAGSRRRGRSLCRSNL